MTQVLETVFGSLSIASVLLLAALGLAIVFGLMGVINMAHGEFMMVGAYTTFLVQNALKKTPLSEAYIFFALIAAFLVTALLGVLLERILIRYLYKRPLDTLLATWGVGLILQQFVRTGNWLTVISVILFCGLFFGAWWVLARQPNFARIKNLSLSIFFTISLVLSPTIASFLLRVLGTSSKAITDSFFPSSGANVTAPKWLLGGLPIGNYQLPYTRLFIIVLTVLCVLAIYWFLNQTAWGLRIRAVTQNRDMSACLGIPTRTVDALTFAIGSGLAGVAGVGISFLGSVSPNTGKSYIILVFMVVVVGGVGKLVGTIVAASVLGTLNYVLGVLMDTSTATFYVFVLIIVFLQFKPAGLFPQKGRSVDA